MTRFFAFTGLAFLLFACSGGTTPPTDAGLDAITCVDCAAPPPGCRYDGGSCTSCGTLVCPDAGPDAGCPTPVDCADPPEGCAYEGGDGCTTCGTIVCGRIACEANGQLFPPLDRACTVDADCGVALHQVDCCGRLRAIGIQEEERAAFDAAEALCRAEYPDCDCAPGPTQADDGTTGETARALCVEGECTSTFLLGPGDVCTPGESEPCGPGLSCCYPCGIEGCDFRCEPTCDPGEPGCAGGCFFRP
jgi:hypothetical protein